jgi:hypothetical protein
MSYDHAAKDAEDLKFTSLEFLCRTRIIDLLEECLILEAEDEPFLKKTTDIRDKGLQYNYQRIGILKIRLRERRKFIPKIIWGMRSNAVTDLFN